MLISLLKQIAKEIADKHGYTLVGEISDIRVDRITQNKERDLSFLTKLAEQYGYIFKIAENNLVFYDVSKLKGAKSTQIFYKSDLTHINLREKTSQKYKAVQVSYFDPKKKKTVKATARNESVVKGDTLKINVRCTDRKQAIESQHFGDYNQRNNSYIRKYANFKRIQCRNDNVCISAGYLYDGGFARFFAISKSYSLFRRC